jgi:hypothetical protein
LAALRSLGSAAIASVVPLAWGRLRAGVAGGMTTRGYARFLLRHDWRPDANLTPIKGNGPDIRISACMDGIGPEHDAALAAVAELLRRERPVPTFDELGRVDRRLNRLRTPPVRPRRGSRLALVFCLALGLVLMTAGTGLAISGFATPGRADHGQSPSRSVGGPPSSTLRPPASAARNRNGASKRRTGGRRPSPSRLGDVAPAGRPTTTVETSLSQAETRSNPPFTGFGAIPILLAGIVLLVCAGAVLRRTRGSWGPA